MQGQISRVSDCHNIKYSMLVLRYVKINRGSEKFGFSLSGNSPVFVRSVDTLSSAAKAGLVPGDFLLEIDGVDAK